MKNKKLITLTLGFIAISIVLLSYVRNMKTGAFLEARNESCKELGNNVTEYFRSENYTPSNNVTIKSCECYYTPDKPDEEVEQKSSNYCTCNCLTGEGENVLVNIRQALPDE